MAFQTITDLYIMEGTPSYLALQLIFVEFEAEADRQVQIDSTNPLIFVAGGEVTLLGLSQSADVPLTIDFDDLTNAGAITVLTLTLEGDSALITVHILVNDYPDMPTDIIVTGNSIAEDAAAATVVATLSTVDTTPGDTFTYSINGNSNFVIVGNEIRLAQNAQIDFETAQTEFLQVLTTDASGNVFVKDLTINIIDANDPPDLDIVAGSQTQDVDENASFQVDLTLSDFNGDAIAITSVSGDTAFFTLEDAPALGSFAVGVFNFQLVFNAPDFESPLDANGDNVYEYTITVSDGSLTTAKTFLFTVADINEPPTIVNFANTVASIGEDASTDARIKVADIVVTDDAIGANALFLVGDDADSFELDGTELFLKAGVSLDFESKQSYSVAIEVDDSDVGTSPDLTSATFTVQVTDVSPETLNGTTDGDTLIGSADIESIFGFAGSDILNGMGNDDTLTGGLGKDWQTGGAGTDIFDFNLKTETVRGANHDVIMDFNRVELDQIDLIGIDAKKGAGNQAFKFIGAKAFHDKAGELHYIKKAGYLMVEGDIDGNGKADFQIEVHGAAKLGAGDFLL
jgi:hypothetical protein